MKYNKYYIFISYSHHDKDLMYRIRNKLNEVGFPVWVDEFLEPGTPSWKIDIQRAMDDSRCVVIVLSPHSSSSRYVREEVNYAKIKHIPIVPVLISGDIDTAIPVELVDSTFIDLRDSQYDGGLLRLINALEQLPDEIVTIGFRGKVPIETMIERSREEIWISGVALDNIARNFSHFRNKLDVSEKFRIRLLALNPQNLEIVNSVNDYFTHRKGSLISRIPDSLADICHDLVSKYPKQVEIRTIDFRPVCAYFITDPTDDYGYMTAVMFLYQFGGVGERPALFMSKAENGKWFDIFLKEFENMWRSATPYTCIAT